MGFIEVLTVFLVAWAVIFFGWGYVKRGKLMQLLNGLQEYGIIEGHNPDRSLYYGGVESRLQNFEIFYRYEYEGKIFKNRQPVSKQSYQQWSYGDTVTILYLPNNPKKSILTQDHTYEKQQRSKARVLFALGTIPVLLLALEIYLVVVFTK